MKKLYISDLDGTLLQSDTTLSKFTAEAVNSLIDKGMVFSYATARSYVSSKRVTEGFSEKIPVIIFNGTFILEGGTGRILLANKFGCDETEYILDVVIDAGVYPFVHRIANDREVFMYLEGKLSRGADRFETERWDDERRIPVNDISMLYGEGVFHFTCIDDRDKLAPLYDKLKNRFECLFYLDPYSREYWLEVQPKRATKANAMIELSKHLGCDEIICFGDGVNDISMFKAADKCYAVQNACPELKAIATDVILSNDDDGVARWLSKNYDK